MIDMASRSDRRMVVIDRQREPLNPQELVRKVLIDR